MIEQNWPSGAVSSKIFTWQQSNYRRLETAEAKTVVESYLFASQHVCGWALGGMGTTFTCLASRQAKCETEYGSSIATLSPVHSLRRRSSCSSDHGTRTGHTQQLQDISVAAVASAVSKGRIGPRELSLLPLDLLQRVIDKLVQTGDPLKLC